MPFVTPKLKVKLPFAFKQVGRDAIEVEIRPTSEPILGKGVHEIMPDLTDAEYEELASKATELLMRTLIGNRAKVTLVSELADEQI